jgi:NAD(P)H dehydrogenase (quinone)
MASGVAWTVLRNSLYADYQVTEARQAIQTGILEHNRGDGLVAYVSRRDCAAAAEAVLRAEGHAGSVYDITGPEPYSPSDLARIYGELGGTNVEAVALDSATLVRRIVSQATNDDHSKYGAELVASFGRSIKDGYMAACTNTVELLTGRPAIRLRQVLEAGYS